MVRLMIRFVPDLLPLTALLLLSKLTHWPETFEYPTPTKVPFQVLIIFPPSPFFTISSFPVVSLNEPPRSCWNVPFAVVVIIVPTIEPLPRTLIVPLYVFSVLFPWDLPVNEQSGIFPH